MYAQTFIPLALSHPEESSGPEMHYGMVGNSAPLQRLLAQMERIGPYFRTALVTGERGTGKELVARALHSLSVGADGPFVVCNAEAAAEPVDKLAAAHGGTLFLDEIGNLPLTTQERLLHVLQRRRSGFTSSQPADARVIATSSRDLKAMCAEGMFRKDLYHRIALVEFKIQPLRTRGGDILLLARHFARHFAALRGKPIITLEPAVLSALAAYAWPGNIRELQQALESAVLRCAGRTIGLEDLPPLSTPRSDWQQPTVRPQEELPMRLDEMVHRHVHQVMHACGGNKLRAADLLGISRSTLYRMLERN
ncbi:MAG TPA: sigma 54-interacting transcriptional regulator [Acidobacteriaceae bacterium]